MMYLASTLPSANFQDLVPEIFDDLHWFLAQYQVFVMIIVAASVAFTVISIIVNIFDRSPHKTEDDDYDIEEY